MPRRRLATTALLALLSAAFLARSAAASAFYVPPALDLAAAAATPAPLGNASAEDSGGPGSAVFDIGNSTAAAAAERTHAAGEEAGPRLDARDVWSPAVTAPDAATVWKVGEAVTVRWCVLPSSKPGSGSGCE